MLVSIAIMAKNEEKNIGKTLSALKTLEKDLNIEIIVVDTGSDDTTMDIAKKYTNKVYFHEWENDFGKMRNISLSYCTGDWVLIVDADEELTNAQELVDFFKKGIYKNYNSASVIVRSYEYEGGPQRVDGIARLFKFTDNFQYTGNIHEQPSYIEPNYVSKIEFIHSGYCKKDYKFITDKFDRNLTLLLEKLKNQPNDAMTAYQIYSTFITVNKKDEAMKFLMKAVKLAQNGGKFFWQDQYVLTESARRLYDFGYNKEALNIALFGIKNLNENIDLNFIAAQAYINLGDISNYYKYINNYLKLIDNDQIISAIKQKGFTPFTIGFKQVAINQKITILYKESKYIEVINYYLKENIEENKIKWLEIFINSCFEEKCYDKISAGLSKLTLYDEIVDEIISYINKMMRLITADEQEEISRYLINIDNKIGVYIKVIYLKEYDIKYIEREINFEKYLEYKAQIIYRLKTKDYCIASILEKVNKDTLSSYMRYLIEDSTNIKYFIDYSKKMLNCGNKEKRRFILRLDKELVFCSIIIENEFLELIGRILINNKEQEISEEKNIEDIFYNTIFSIVKNKDKVLLDNISKMKEFYPYMRVMETVKRFLKVKSDSKEIRIEEEKILGTVEGLITNGQVKKAKNVLTELNQIIRFDFRIYNNLGVVEFLNEKYYDALFLFNVAVLFNEEDYDSIYCIAQILLKLDRTEDSKEHLYKICNKCNNEYLIKQAKDMLNEIDEYRE